MLPRRAPKVILACSIALWAIAGLLPDQTAFGANTAQTENHQTEGVSGNGSTEGRDLSSTTSPSGDPDGYTTQSGGGSPLPGSGTGNSTGDRSILEIVLDLLLSWWSQVGGLPPQ